MINIIIETEKNKQINYTFKCIIYIYIYIGLFTHII